MVASLEVVNKEVDQTQRSVVQERKQVDFAAWVALVEPAAVVPVVETSTKIIPVPTIQELVDKIVGMVEYNAKKEDARDIGEFLAYEIIDLIEICIILDDQATIAQGVLDDMELPTVAKTYVRKHFDLWLSS